MTTNSALPWIGIDFKRIKFVGAHEASFSKIDSIRLNTESNLIILDPNFVLLSFKD